MTISAFEVLSNASCERPAMACAGFAPQKPLYFGPLAKCPPRAYRAAFSAVSGCFTFHPLCVHSLSGLLKTGRR